MPPRKSTDSAKTGAASGVDENATSNVKEPSGLGVEDLNLPRSMIQRLAKGVLPPNTQIQKDALLAMSKSATVFVNYLASQANERTVGNGKRTIQPKDVLEALADLEFEAFLPRCEVELQKYTTIQSDKRNNYRRKIRDGKRVGDSEINDSTITDGPSSLADPGPNGHTNGQLDDEHRATKKSRTSLDPTTNGNSSHTHGENGVEEGEDDTIGEDEDDEQAAEVEEEDDDEEEEEDEDDFVTADGSDAEEVDATRLEEDPLEPDHEDKESQRAGEDEESDSD